MILKIKWSHKVISRVDTVTEFFQHMANRLLVGELRYGAARAEQRYMSRLLTEYNTYRRTGNRENLLNIANYAYLESIAPENPKNHFNPLVGSATRHRFGGERREGD